MGERGLGQGGGSGCRGRNHLDLAVSYVILVVFWYFYKYNPNFCYYLQTLNVTFPNCLFCCTWRTNIRRTYRPTFKLSPCKGISLKITRPLKYSRNLKTIYIFYPSYFSDVHENVLVIRHLNWRLNRCWIVPELEKIPSQYPIPITCSVLLTS